MVGPEIGDSDLTNQLLKCLADIIRPQTFVVNNMQTFHELLTATLKVSASVPIGLACNGSGQMAIALEKEVLLVSLKDYGTEDLGLFAFALSFLGLAVVHSIQDKNNLMKNFPKVFCDLLDRVRIVDNPSEIIYIAANPFEEVTDRATQAKIDAINNPAPLLPTPDVSAASTPDLVDNS